MKLYLSKREIALSGALLGAVVWGGWVTEQLLHPKHEVVRLSAASLVQEYMVAVAHSNWTADQIKTQTNSFTSTMDALIGQESAAGRTVLMTEAVLSKDTPDITPEIRAELMKRVQWPAPGSSGPVQPLVSGTDAGSVLGAAPLGNGGGH